MEKVKIGIITKPQALKGAFRVKPNILNFKKIKKLHEIFIDSISYEIESVSIRDTFVILKVKGIETPESAEKLRNKEIWGEIEIESNNSFDLENWKVIIGDASGVIIDINNYGSKDILTLQLKNRCMLPLLDELVLEKDENTKTIYLNKEIFEQVVVYED